MNIKIAKEEIKHTVSAYLQKDEAGEYLIPSIRQRPLLLMGPPGIGKTQIMEQVARECEIGLVAYTITHHTRQSAVGLPFIQEKVYDGKPYNVTEYTMSEIIASVYESMERTGLKEGILFLDEINCVSETLAPTMLQFLQCKTFGNQEVPKGWIIVAAGNPPEYNKSVREFDIVTLDRVRCMNIEADYAVWKEYAKEVNIHNAIISYLDLKPKNFYGIETTVDGVQFVTARGWEDFSNLMCSYEKLGFSITEELVRQFLPHEEIAEEVGAYIELYYRYQDDYGIQDILQGKVDSSVYERLMKAAFDEKITVINLLLDGLMLCMEQFVNTKEFVDNWYNVLKEYRSRIEQCSDAKQCYLEMVEEYSQEISEKKKAQLYTRAQERKALQLLERLKQNIPEQCDEKKECFGQAQAGFVLERERMEQYRQEGIQAVEYAFDFMEAAFADSEELVYFITELTMSSVSGRFFMDYACERYLHYNKEYMIGSRKRQLLTQLHR